MESSIVITEVMKLGTVDDTKYYFRKVYVPSNAKRIVRLQCFGIAQTKINPFSIYPIEFGIESGDNLFVWFKTVAIPHPDIKVVGNKIVSSDVYIVSSDDPLDISRHGGELFLLYAKPLIAHIAAPRAFCVVTFEVK